MMGIDDEHLQSSAQQPSSRHHGLPDAVLRSTNGTMKGNAVHEVCYSTIDAASMVDHSSTNGVSYLPSTPQTAAAVPINDSIRGGEGEKLEHGPAAPKAMGSWEAPRTYFGFLQTFASMASGVMNWVTRFPNGPRSQDVPRAQTARDSGEGETLLLKRSSSAAHISSQRSTDESGAIDHSDPLQLSVEGEAQDSKQELLCCSVDDELPEAKAENHNQNVLHIGPMDEAITGLVSKPLSSVPEHGCPAPRDEVAAEIMISASVSLPQGDLAALQPADNYASAESGKREGTLSTRSQRTHASAADGPRCGTCYFCKRPSLNHKCLNELVDAWTKPKRKYKPRKPKVSDGISCLHLPRYLLPFLLKHLIVILSTSWKGR